MSGTKRLEGAGFSFSDVKTEMDIQQEVNADASDIAEKVDLSLIRIKTEPNFDCDTISANVNFEHQELNPFETVNAIKEEFNDTDHNNVTVNLLVPDSILAEETFVDIQTNSEGNLPANQNSIDSNVPITQPTETTEDNIHLNARATTTEKTSIQDAPSESKEKQKSVAEFLILESPTPQASGTGLSEIVTKQIEISENKGSSNNKRKSKVSEKVSVSEIEFIDLSSESETSIIESPLPKKRGRKKGSTKTKESRKKEEKVVCPFCDRRVVKSYFPHHARVHTDEKPFKCSKCPYASHFKEPLHKHIVSHHPTEGSESETSIIGSPPQPKKRGRKKASTKTERPKNTEMVVCPFCDRRLAKSYFPYHARVHTDEKPYKCSKCSYSSHFKGPLVKHAMAHHPTEGYIKQK